MKRGKLEDYIKKIGNYTITEMDLDFLYDGSDFTLDIYVKNQSCIENNKELEHKFKEFLALIIKNKIADRIDDISGKRLKDY